MKDLSKAGDSGNRVERTHSRAIQAVGRVSGIVCEMKAKILPQGAHKPGGKVKKEKRKLF